MLKAKKDKALAEQGAGGALFFASPTDLVKGLPSQLEPAKIEKKVVTLKAGEQPTAEQLKGATSIIQLGSGTLTEQEKKAQTQPVTAFFDNITNQIKSFTQQQEVVAKTSDNIIEKGLATIGSGVGKLAEAGFSTSPVGIALKGASLIEQADQAGVPKKVLEKTQDDLFNIITVQKQIAEKGTNPMKEGLQMLQHLVLELVSN